MCYLPVKTIGDTVANEGQYQILDSVNFYLSFPSLNWNNVTPLFSMCGFFVLFFCCWFWGLFTFLLHFPTCTLVLTGFQLSHNMVRKAFLLF